MLTILLIIINLTVTILGVYLFDYKPDEAVDQPLIIILSIIGGVLSTSVILYILMDGLYLLVAKTRPINSKFKHFLAKHFMAIPIHATNTRVKVIGKENLPKEPGFSIYANHTSMMDIPYLMYKLNKYPVAFLAKDIVRKVFLIGKWTPELGCISIDRSNDRKAAESIINVIKNVKNGLTMVIFPEGTRSKKIGSIKEFKAGSFKVALKSKAPLVPITIVKPKNFDEVKWPFPKRVTIVIHKPIPFAEFRKMTSIDLSDKVREIIASKLQE